MDFLTLLFWAWLVFLSGWGFTDLLIRLTTLSLRWRLAMRWR
jgi:hypothetical protein